MDKPGSICPVGTVRMVPGCHARLSDEAELWMAAVYRANPGLGCGLVNDDAVYLASLIAAINSIVGGIGLAAVDCQIGSAASAALPVGITAAVVLFGLHLLYQHQRATNLGPQMSNLAATLEDLGDLQDAATCLSRSWPAAGGRSSGQQPRVLALVTRPCPAGACSWGWGCILAALLGGHGIGNQQVFGLATSVADEQVDHVVAPPGGLQAGRGSVVADHDLGGGRHNQ